MSSPTAAEPRPADPGQDEVVRPPPTNVDYLQFGVAFTGAISVNPGAVCPPNAQAPCILGSGGGLLARGGHRSRGPWYFGGAYSFTKLDTNSLMRLGVLQQLGAEARYLASLGVRAEPYLAAGMGGSAFGNEWGLETAGAHAWIGAGIETQVTRTTVVGLMLSYRPVLLLGWTDRAGQQRETGVAHYIWFELAMEAREPLQTH